MAIVKVSREQTVVYDDHYTIPFRVLCDFVNGYESELLEQYGIIDAHDSSIEAIEEFVNEFIQDFVFWAEQEAGVPMVSRWASGNDRVEFIKITMEDEE